MTTTTLAIETATANAQQAASICLQHNGEETLQMLPDGNAQAAQIVPQIERLFNKNHMWYNDLTHLAITIGPGSFTGIRIGLAVARAIQFSYPSLRIHPVTTLEALVAGYEGTETTLNATLRAGKGEFYAQNFWRDTHWHASSEIALIHPDDLPPDATIIGHAADEQSAINAAMVLRASQNMAHTEARDLTPLYIRPPDAKRPQANRL